MSNDRPLSFNERIQQELERRNNLEAESGHKVADTTDEYDPLDSKAIPDHKEIPEFSDDISTVTEYSKDLLDNHPQMDSSVIDSSLASSIYKYLMNKPSRQGTIHEMSNYFELKSNVLRDVLVLMKDNGVLEVDPKVATTFHVVESNKDIPEKYVETKKTVPTYDLLKEKQDFSTKYLSQIATDQVTPDDVAEFHKESKTMDMMKVFMIQSARNELVRAVKTTEALYSMQDAFIEKSLKNKDKYDIETLSNVTTKISDMLDRSFSIIDRFSKDEELKVFFLDLGGDMDTVRNSASVNPGDVLADKSSRDNVRKSSAKLLGVLEGMLDKGKSDGSSVSERKSVSPDVTTIPTEETADNGEIKNIPDGDVNTSDIISEVVTSEEVGTSTDIDTDNSTVSPRSEGVNTDPDDFDINAKGLSGMSILDKIR